MTRKRKLFLQALFMGGGFFALTAIFVLLTHAAHAAPPPPPTPSATCSPACARNEICDASSGTPLCVKICDDECAPVCSGGHSCDGSLGWTQCLDGTTGARLGKFVIDNPDTSCKTGKRIFLETRTCANFDADPCYEFGEAVCPDRNGCIDPPGNAQCKPFNDAECKRINAPDRIVTGNLFTGDITVKNTGIASWCYWGRWTGGDPLYALGSKDPDFNKRWGIDLLFPPNLKTIVSPGQSQTFTFRFKAPNLSATYPFSWQMLLQGLPQLGNEWFGDICTKNIQVRPIPQVDNSCPQFDHVKGENSCSGGSSSESGSLGTSTCATSCSDCTNKCQDLFGQNATFLWDSTSGRCGCESPSDFDPEAALGQQKTCNSASGDPPFNACVLGGKSGVPCYNLTDCTKGSHTVCDYGTQSCTVAGGPGIDQCGGAGNPDDALCKLTSVPPNQNTCGGKYTLNNPLGNFGDPNCDFSKDKLAKLLQQLDPANWKFWYFTVVSCESGYNPNAYNPSSIDPAGSWGLFQMGRGRLGPLDHGDVIWNLQAYNAVQYNNTQLGGDFSYWPCATPSVH